MKKSDEKNQQVHTKLDETSKNIFGEMREAAREERDSIDNYVKSISENTGISFWDIKN